MAKITSTSISAGDRLGAQLGSLAALMLIAKKSGHRVVFFSEYVDHGVGIRFLDDFLFSSPILIIGRKQRVLHLVRKAFSLALEVLHRVVRKSSILGGLITRIKARHNAAWQRIIKESILYFYGFRTLGLTWSLPADIPSIEHHQNYDVNGDFSMFIPNLMADLGYVSSSVRFKPAVLAEANKQYHRYMFQCSSQRLLAVHFRRGDYLALSSLNLGPDYYVAALRRFPPSEWALLIFSDDISYCKKLTLFSGYSVEFSDAKSDVLDMAIMSLCDGLIAANSSFSFWGGLLGARPGRPVVCPRQFFGEVDPVHSKLNGLWFPKEWIAIDVSSNASRN
jgi:hypothetical protein